MDTKIKPKSTSTSFDYQKSFEDLVLDKAPKTKPVPPKNVVDPRFHL